MLILALWYHSTYYNKIPDNQLLILDSSENVALLFPPPTYSDIDQGQLASRVLETIYNVTASPDDCIIGTNLSGEVYNLRDTIGVDLQIAVNKDRRRPIHQSNATDNDNIGVLGELDEKNQLQLANNFISKLLEKRWEQIKSYFCDILEPRGGSYLYLSSQPRGIKGHQTTNGVRINLLCTDMEFITLIKRLLPKNGYTGPGDGELHELLI